MIGNKIENLIKIVSRFPSLGRRSAQRIVLHLLKNREGLLKPLVSLLNELLLEVRSCEVCGNLDSTKICSICSDNSRNKHIICVVADVSDLWALERTNTFKGHYHVLGGLLSATMGLDPEDLNLQSLLSRIEHLEVEELILALPVTLDGQTTVHYIADLLSESSVKITKPSQGIPVGGELDYLDEGTIANSFKSRQNIS